MQDGRLTPGRKEAPDESEPQTAPQEESVR